jgi:dTDP-4-dehydrorhamnose 3,5-epimerase
MNFVATNLEGCFVLEPKIIKDDRGYFMESYNESTFQKVLGIKIHFVQDNQSFSSKGVLRGLHYQVGEHSQSKLVRVLTGEILDVAVDIRSDSKTYGNYFSVVLSAENHKQLFIPAGFAHGFVVLSETATLFYKCDNFYHKESEGGVIFNDPELNIDWGEESKDWIISEKDKNLPLLKNSRKIW